jgi:hypothetical protein
LVADWERRSSEESIIPTTQDIQPSANVETIEEGNPKSPFGKNVSLGEALLLMARIAADWSDSDEEDVYIKHSRSRDRVRGEATSKTPEADVAFIEKLHQALQKEMQQSKPPGEAQGRAELLSSKPCINSVIKRKPVHRPQPRS